jgi:hypothetical protein
LKLANLAWVVTEKIQLVFKITLWSDQTILGYMGMNYFLVK